MHSGVQINGTGNIAGDLFPEGTSTNFTGHQVRTVETEAGSLIHEFRNTPVQSRTVHILCSGLVGSNCATTFHPTRDGLRGGEVFHQSTGFGAVIEHGHEVASYKERLPIGFINGGQIEEVIVNAIFSIFGEEAGDEVGLFVQPALGRVVEHRHRGVAKVRGNDGLTAAKHVVIVKPQVTPSFDSILNFGGIEGQFTSNPRIVVV